MICLTPVYTSSSVATQWNLADINGDNSVKYTWYKHDDEYTWETKCHAAEFGKKSAPMTFRSNASSENRIPTWTINCTRRKKSNYLQKFENAGRKRNEEHRVFRPTPRLRRKLNIVVLETTNNIPRLCSTSCSRWTTRRRIIDAPKSMYRAIFPASISPADRISCSRELSRANTARYFVFPSRARKSPLSFLAEKLLPEKKKRNVRVTAQSKPRSNAPRMSARLALRHSVRRHFGFVIRTFVHLSLAGPGLSFHPSFPFSLLLPRVFARVRWASLFVSLDKHRLAAHRRSSARWFNSMTIWENEADEFQHFFKSLLYRCGVTEKMIRMLYILHSMCKQFIFFNNVNNELVSKYIYITFTFLLRFLYICVR